MKIGCNKRRKKRDGKPVPQRNINGLHKQFITLRHRTVPCLKGDYINLGAGSELGIYYGDEYGHWFVDKSLAMKMHMTLFYKGNPIIDYAPSQKQWWITGFNPNPDYKNVNAEDLMVTYFLHFSDMGMFNAFKSQQSDSGWCFFDGWAMLIF